MKLPKWVWVLVVVLICLPVLFVVVGILAGLFLPGVTRALGKPESVQAENTAYNLRNAISAYFTEYRAYPSIDAEHDVTMDSDHALMDILLGSDKEKEQGGRNYRGITFFTNRAAKSMDEGRFRTGITLDPDGRGQLWDPWGNFYRIRFDSNPDNKVENPDPESPSNFLPESILVWSAGPDGDFDTWEDNVKTWQGLPFRTQ